MPREGGGRRERRRRPAARAGTARPRRRGAANPRGTARGRRSAGRRPAPRTRTQRTASSAPAAPSVWPIAPLRPWTGTDPALGPRTCARAASSIASLKTVPVPWALTKPTSARPRAPRQEGCLDGAGQAATPRIGRVMWMRVRRPSRSPQPRENRAPRAGAPRLSLLEKEETPRPRPARGRRARVERPGNRSAEGTQRVEAREDERREASAPPARTRVARPSRIHSAASPTAAAPERTPTKRSDRASCAVPAGEVAGERARVAPGESAGPARPRREPLREGPVSRKRRPDGDSRAVAAEGWARRERLDRGVAREQRLQLRSVRPARTVDQGRLPRVKATRVEPRDWADRRPASERAFPERVHAPAKRSLGAQSRHDDPRHGPHVVSIIARPAPRAAPRARKAIFSRP